MLINQQWIKLPEAAALLGLEIDDFFHLARQGELLSSGALLLPRLWIYAEIVSPENPHESIKTWVFLLQSELDDFISAPSRSTITPSHATLETIEDGEEIWDPVTLAEDRAFSASEIHLRLGDFNRLKELHSKDRSQQSTPDPEDLLKKSEKPLSSSLPPRNFEPIHEAYLKVALDAWKSGILPVSCKKPSGVNAQGLAAWILKNHSKFESVSSYRLSEKSLSALISENRKRFLPTGKKK